MRILIFGITGNTGKEIAQFYLKKNCQIWGVGRKKSFALNIHNYISADIRNTELFDLLPNEFDVVINLAGVQPSILPFSEITDLYKTTREYIDVNVLGTYNIIEFIAKSKIKTYLYATTHRDYELYWHERKFLGNNLPAAINLDGDHSMYAITKVTGKLIGDYILKRAGIRYFNLRLPMIFLIPDSPFYLQNGQKRMMPFLQIIYNAINGKDLEIWGDPSMPRDYVYIENLTNMIHKLIYSDLQNGTFTVGTGEAVSTETFIKTIGKVFGTKGINYIYKPEKVTYKSAIYDVSEQKKLFGYEPILLEEMLKKCTPK